MFLFYSSRASCETLEIVAMNGFESISKRLRSEYLEMRDCVLEIETSGKFSRSPIYIMSFGRLRSC